MTRPRRSLRLRARLRRFLRETRGTSLVEIAVVLPVFLLVFMGLLDFGRYAFHVVTTEKTLHIATRIAAVRPPACGGVPDTHERPNGAVLNNAPGYGTRCNAGGNICAPVATVSCTGSLANATVAEIWPRVSPTLPTTATPANLRFSYAYDPNLGFLGGPYVPVVTVELVDADFDFVSLLGGFVAMAGGSADGAPGWSIALPNLSVSMPGEDLAHGNEG